MRRYDDLVEVRKGMVGGHEGPEQFLWRGRLWKVSDVLAHWVETGPWWISGTAHAVLGTEDREVWRVEAARGRSAPATGRGVFDLVFDWADGSWQLARCVD
jgi:hypothetical protein